MKDPPTLSSPEKVASWHPPAVAHLTHASVHQKMRVRAAVVSVAWARTRLTTLLIATRAVHLYVRPLLPFLLEIKQGGIGSLIFTACFLLLLSFDFFCGTALASDGSSRSGDGATRTNWCSTETTHTATSLRHLRLCLDVRYSL